MCVFILINLINIKSTIAQWCPTLWLHGPEALLSMNFTRQEYWSGLPFPTPGGSSQPRDRTCLSCIAGRIFTPEPPGKTHTHTHVHAYLIYLFSNHCSWTAAVSEAAWNSSKNVRLRIKRPECEFQLHLPAGWLKATHSKALCLLTLLVSYCCTLPQTW